MGLFDGMDPEKAGTTVIKHRDQGRAVFRDWANRVKDHWEPLLRARAIENSSRAGDVVLDLFLGPGTTLIAAERTGRVCYGVELDPHYCDIVLARWESFAGQKAERLDG